MTLIRLECGDQNRCVRAFVISIIESYWDTDVLVMAYHVRYLDHRVIFDGQDDYWGQVHDDYWDRLLLYAVQEYEILTCSRLDCPLSNIWIRYCINSCYWKLLGKYCWTVTLSLFYCSTVYTVILFTLLLLHWYCYCYCIVLLSSPCRPSTLDNIDIDWFKWIE